VDVSALQRPDWIRLALSRLRANFEFHYRGLWPERFRHIVQNLALKSGLPWILHLQNDINGVP
jgi:hypothetical protein